MSKKFDGIWIGQKDLTGDKDFILDAQNEFRSPSLVDAIADDSVEDTGAPRRDFLKMMGFGLGAATVAAGCNTPVRRAIPYVVKPDEIVPGVANYYASTYVNGGDYCSVLVKTREGRPIKIDGNDLSPLTKGGTCARAQASVMSLYDVNRLKQPVIDEQKVSWADLDAKVAATLGSSRGIRFVTNTMLSPSDKKALAELKSKYPRLEVVTYDPVSSAAILEANEINFGQRVIPNYKFDAADLIVSFNADFLGTWISPTEYAKAYAKNRVVKEVAGATISKHIQVESQMSMTGSNADNRILVKPSEQGAAIVYLYQEIMGGSASSSPVNEKAKAALRNLAKQLVAHKGKSLIVSASNNVAEQQIVNAMNVALGNYGHTLSFEHASLQRQGDEKELVKLVADIKSGTVDTVIYNNCNPIFEYSAMPGLAEALTSVPNRIGMMYHAHETTLKCNIIAPIHHYLESWNDAEPKRGVLSMVQPTISPLFDTRQMGTSLLTWAGSKTVDMTDMQPYYLYVRKNMEEQFKGQSKFITFDAFWDRTLNDGVFSASDDSPNPTSADINVSLLLSKVTQPQNTDVEIQFIEPLAVGNGVYANNPWLQELPDPVNRTTWGNYLMVPLSYNGRNKFNGYNDLKDGDLADIQINGKTVRVPVIQQFGQMPGTVSLAIGYGRTAGGTCAVGIGNDVNPMMSTDADGRLSYWASDVSVSGKKGREEDFSCVQYFNSIGVTAENEQGETFNADETTLAPGYGNLFKGFQGSLVKRSIIRHSHIDNLAQAVDDLVHEREHHEKLNAETLYPYDKYVENQYSQGHHWGMHVDLNACTGCGACVVSCHAENNVPVVGKKQVARHQEMAWLRIDRYFYGDVENPNAVYQPMMCQHCDNAPCENVCPVNATNHSSEGLNQMTYNRCIGTRYCANNCPYKVRRFNWLDYTTADLFPANQVKVNPAEDLPYGADNLTRMVLNPDVMVRTRGVIEKCSFCVQKIQQGKLTAKVEGRQLADADVTTACQTACPTGAIVFGDTNNMESEVYKAFESPLNMIVLEEINVRPSVRYTMKVNNRDESLEVT